MIIAIRAELYKITTTRMTYGFLGIAAGLTALVTMVLSAQAGSSSVVPSLATATGIHPLPFAAMTGILAALLVILSAVTAHRLSRDIT